MAPPAWNADLRSARAALRAAHLTSLTRPDGAPGRKTSPPRWHPRLGTPTSGRHAQRSAPRTSHHSRAPMASPAGKPARPDGTPGLERRPPVGTRGAPRRAPHIAHAPRWRPRPENQPAPMAPPAWNADLRSARAALRAAHLTSLTRPDGAPGRKTSPPRWHPRLGTPTSGRHARRSAPRTSHHSRAPMAPPAGKPARPDGTPGLERRPPVGTRGAPRRARRNLAQPHDTTERGGPVLDVASERVRVVARRPPECGKLNPTDPANAGS